MFSIGDKVIITSKDGFLIGGIHNHDTDEGLREKFGLVINYSRCFKTVLCGEIIRIGKCKNYIIKSENKNFVFSNKYKEMKIDKAGR